MSNKNKVYRTSHYLLSTVKTLTRVLEESGSAA